MDDPWGSPWADELNNNNSLAIRSIDDVADGNQVGNASEASRDNVNTTWNTSNDGFGDWEEDTGEKNRGLGLDGAAEQWNTPQRGRELESVKDDVRKLSSGWDNFSTNPTREVPKLSPSLLAKPATITAREPSPDPWADAIDESAAIDNKVSSDSTISNPEPIVDIIEKKTEEDTLEVFEATVPQLESPSETKVEPEKPTLDETVTEATDGLDEANSEAIGLGIGEESESDSCAGDAEEEHHESDDTVLPSAQAPEHESSRPSSSPSDTSNHNELLADSPRTSLDEEPKRSRVTRAVSPNVQELVEHFDGSMEPKDELAVKSAEKEEDSNSRTELVDAHVAVVEPENPDDNKVEEDSNAEESDDDDFGDFGEFEEGLSDDDEEVEIHDPIMPPVLSDLATPQNEPPEIRFSKRPSGPVDFSINLVSLETLFGEPEQNNGATAEKVFIPDTIIADTFASTEERKMWYRLSRYGTMRKYNTGDDENYVRISWAQSQVKQDTLKIVARWMEEDRNSGHVNLGGTSKGGSLFGWNDPNAPPVPLATVLGSKRKSVKLEAKIAAKESVAVPREWPKYVARDRSRSKSRSSSKPRENSSMKSVESGTNIKAPLQPPIAQFGWASSPTTQTISDSNSFPSNTGSFAKPLPLQVNSAFGYSPQLSPTLHSPGLMSPIAPPPSFLQAVKKPRPISMPPPSTNSSNNISIANLAITTNASNDENDDDDDDDGWGEMVSSPVITEAPKFPTRGLRHKKSMSLVNSFTNSNTLPNPQIMKLQSGFGHKSTSSLDNTLGNPKNPIMSQPPLLSGAAIPSPISSNPSFADLWSTPASTPSPIQSTAIPPSSPALSTTAISTISPQPISSLPSNTTFNDSWSRPPLSNSSISAPPTTSTWPQPSNSSIPSVSTSTQDPWASADFSFFDAPASTPVPTPTPPFLSKQITNSRPQSYPAPPKPKTVTFSTPSSTSTPSPPAPTYASHDSKTKFEMGQNEILKRIVDGLPNLGYMLRR